MHLLTAVGLTAGGSSRQRLKCDGTRAETRFRSSVKRTSPFKSAGASVQSTTGGRGVRISGSNVGYTVFRGSVKSTGYPLHSPVSPSLPIPCVTVCHHISTGVYSTQLQTIHRTTNFVWMNDRMNDRKVKNIMKNTENIRANVTLAERLASLSFVAIRNT